MLAVDDDVVILESLKRLSAAPHHGYRYEVAGTFAEAMDRLPRLRPSAVLCDYQLDDGYGTDLVALSHVPVVVMTGHGSESVAAEALRAGAFDYLIKDPEGRFMTLVEPTLDRALGRWRAELAERERAAELLEMQRQHRALAGFASTIANSLSTPLQVISHYCGLLTGHQPIRSDRLAQSYAQAANEASRRANQMITESLEYAQLKDNSAQFGSVDTAATVHDVLKDLRVLMGSGADSVRVSQLPWVIGDRVQLRTLFYRLLRRAIRRCEGSGRPIDIELQASSEGPEVHFLLTDGAPTQEDGKAVGNYFWEEPGKPQMNLDFAISRRIVEMHGGRIWLSQDADARPHVGVALRASNLE